MEIKKVNITHENKHLINDFLLNGGSALNSFRYFSKRPIDVINNHIYTLLFLKNDLPVCYGHLDKEKNEIWLGIAVVENEQGKGLGKKMMQDLIQKAKEKNIPAIYLTVDKENENAIKLYTKIGFTIETIYNTYIKYCLKLDQ